MLADKIKAEQKQRRADCLKAILASAKRKKLLLPVLERERTFTFGKSS
ncbi:MAG: hypothetical protein WDM76_03400 [Limisphaerales bacterium]